MLVPGLHDIVGADHDIACTVLGRLTNMHIGVAEANDLPKAISVHLYAEDGYYVCYAFGFEFPVSGQDLDGLRGGGSDNCSRLIFDTAFVPTVSMSVEQQPPLPPIIYTGAVAVSTRTLNEAAAAAPRAVPRHTPPPTSMHFTETPVCSVAVGALRGASYSRATPGSGVVAAQAAAEPSGAVQLGAAAFGAARRHTGSRRPATRRAWWPFSWFQSTPQEKPWEVQWVEDEDGRERARNAKLKDTLMERGMHAHTQSDPISTRMSDADAVDSAAVCSLPPLPPSPPPPLAAQDLCEPDARRPEPVAQQPPQQLPLPVSDQTLTVTCVYPPDAPAR